MDIGKGIQRSFELFTKNAGLLIPAGIVVMLISIFTFGILGGIRYPWRYYDGWLPNVVPQGYAR